MKQLESALVFGPLHFGLVLSAIVNFLLKAAVVYFLIVRPFATVATRLAARSAPPPDVQVLTEIRDSLKTRNAAGV